MSCTVVAVPIALSWIAQTILTGTLITGGAIGLTAASYNKNRELYAIDDESIEGCNSEDHEITYSHFIEKEFETPFTDKNLLVKTLEEHGVQGIEASEDFISGKVDNYKLQFTKYYGKEAYTLRISCTEQENAEEKVGDITSEYSMNVQEDVYLHILDKLKENNMQIEEETVEDDNTIVLTVNLD